MRATMASSSNKMGIVGNACATCGAKSIGVTIPGNRVIMIDGDANIGVNFAASMKLVLRVVNDLKDHGRVIRGKPGFGVRELTERERAALSGVAIDRVARGGAAIEAGLEVGDVITAIDGRKVRRASDVPSAVHMARPGDSIAIAFIRGGQSRRASLVLRP